MNEQPFIRAHLVGGALDGSDLLLACAYPTLEIEVYTSSLIGGDSLRASGRTVLYHRRGKGEDGAERYDYIPWGVHAC